MKEFNFTTELEEGYIGNYKDDLQTTSDPIRAIIEWDFLLDIKEWGVKIAEPVINKVTVYFEDDSKLIIEDDFDIVPPEDNANWIPVGLHLYDGITVVGF